MFPMWPHRADVANYSIVFEGMDMANIAELLRSVATFQSGIYSIRKYHDNATSTVMSTWRVLSEKQRRFAEVCVKLRWPPPWHLPGTAIDRIVNAYNSGSLSAQRTAEIFASFYTAERIGEFGSRWVIYPWLRPRIPILREALDNHVEGRHYSAVCVLMPQIEGVLREVLGENPTRHNITDVIRGSDLDEAAATFYTDVLLENFYPDSAAPIPELSRHAILHGKAIDYGTPTHSLKLILIADIILSIIEENRRQPADEMPGVDT
jgi:hypothetical protein